MTAQRSEGETPQMRELELKITIDEANLILEGLGNLPFAKVFALVAKIQDTFGRDVEEVIYEIPQVKEVTVVGIAGRPFAFVIARGERPTPASVISYCKRRLPPHLVPRFVIFVDDFPRTFIGKVLRRELARKYEKQSD